jgi:7,8-dihydroneopterin aldolase/epimerase/oxygenase
MDTIRIGGLKVETLIGVHAWERKLPRTVVVDLAMAADAAAAARTDQLDGTLDYHAIATRTAAFVKEARVQLIETLAEQLAAELMKAFSLRWLAVTVHKPGAVPGAQDVSVSIERGQK